MAPHPPGDKCMTLTVPLSVIALVLSSAPAWAVDSSAEVDFLTRASNANLFAVEESRLAIDRTRDPKLKTFARQMLKDHGGAQSELQATAKGSGAAVPPTLDQEHQARLKALRSKSGADFDNAYIADQCENHSNALTLYADYMLWGEYEQLHALAVKMIPITEAQLKQAQVLAGD